MIQKSSEITLSEDPRLVASILHYMYIGDLYLDPIDGWNMWKLAHRLNLHSLPTEIVNLTIHDWHLHEIFQVYFMSLDPKDPLVHKVKFHIEDHFDAFVNWTFKDKTCKLGSPIGLIFLQIGIWIVMKRI
jgi:hypothetical protein